MTYRLPPLNALRAFEVVARHLSMRRAAGELHVTPAAVSQQVKLLERHLGKKLLRRTSEGYILTESAEAGIADLRDGFDRLARAADKMVRSGRRILTVSVEPSLAATWLVSRLDRLKARHPDLDVLFQATSALADFDRDPIDVAVRYGAGNYPGLRAERFFDEEVFPVCSQRLLAGEPPLRTPDDLRQHTLLHLAWAPRTGEWPDWSSWLMAAGVTGIDTDRGLRFTEHAMALQAAAEGQGVALGSTALVADHLAAGRLVQPFVLTVPTRSGYYVVYPEQRAHDPSILAFRDWILGEAGRA